MFNNINIKKFAAYTAMTMVAAFVLSGVIFFSTGGVNAVIQNVGKSNRNFNIEKVFNTAGINNINIDTSSIDVHFIPEDRNDIKINLTGYSNSGEPELRVEQSGDSIDVYARNNNRGVFITIGFNIIDLRLDVHVPASYSRNIKVKTSSGDLRMDKLSIENFYYDASSGDLMTNDFTTKSSDIETSSGDIKLNGFGGDLELRTSSGDGVIEYASKAANTSITTSSGDFRVIDFTGNLKTRAQSGDIKVDYASFNNSIEMHSSSGDVELNLPADAQFGIKVNTSSGDIRTDFSVAQSGRIDEDNLEGTVGNSSNQITIRTSSGDVKIGKR